MESEIKGIDKMACCMLHAADILQFVVGEFEWPLIIYADTLSGKDLLESLKTNLKVKYINMRIHFLRELIMEGKLQIHFVPGRYNVADVLTKPLSNEQFEFLRDILMHGHKGVVPNWSSEETVHLAVTAIVLMSLLN